MRKILYFDMDNVLVDFLSAEPLLSPEVLKEYKDNLDEVPGVFSLMAPLPGAIDAFNELSVLFDAYILSVVRNAVSPTISSGLNIGTIYQIILRLSQ